MRWILPTVTGAFLCSAAPALARGIETNAVPSAAVIAERVDYRGRAALRVRKRAGGAEPCCLVALPGAAFRNGTIEAWVAGRPVEGASEGARGFVGLAFRTQADGRYEAFYIRPTNGRADDQLRRNHATQYISEPEHPWHRLRREAPGVYESYADMVAGEWMRLRVEVEGARARLYVGDAVQPALIVNDLKLGADASGGVALWVEQETDAHFADVRVTRRD
jgi:hypothetical protein